MTTLKLIGITAIVWIAIYFVSSRLYYINPDFTKLTEKESISLYEVRQMNREVKGHDYHWEYEIEQTTYTKGLSLVVKRDTLSKKLMFTAD